MGLTYLGNVVLSAAPRRPQHELRRGGLRGVRRRVVVVSLLPGVGDVQVVIGGVGSRAAERVALQVQRQRGGQSAHPDHGR